MGEIFDSIMAGAGAGLRASPDQLRDHRDYVAQKQAATFSDVLRAMDGTIEQAVVIAEEACALAQKLTGEYAHPAPETASSGSARVAEYAGLPPEMMSRVAALQMLLGRIGRANSLIGNVI